MSLWNLLESKNSKYANSYFANNVYFTLAFSLWFACAYSEGSLELGFLLVKCPQQSQ